MLLFYFHIFYNFNFFYEDETIIYDEIALLFRNVGYEIKLYLIVKLKYLLKNHFRIEINS